MPPLPQRERYHSASHAPRHSKKEDTRSHGKKSSRADHGVLAAAATAAAGAPSAAVSTREEVLREALAKALANPSAGTSTALEEVDSYGKGAPTDRLQFGYSPAVAAEAVAFHSRFTPEAWREARLRNGRHTFVKKQKLSPVNCEPLTSILKLQRHWRTTNTFKSDASGSGGSRLKAADLDHLLDMLASKQRIGEDE